jgi:hypothetical protein
MSQNFQEISGPRTDRFSNESKGHNGFRIVLTLILLGLFSTTSLLVFDCFAVSREESQSDSSTLERFRKLENRITALEERERMLTQEIRLITAKNGVLERLIEHVKELRAQDQFIVRQMEYSPGVHDRRIEPAQENGGFGAQHTVVTPRPKISTEEEPSQDE